MNRMRIVLSLITAFVLLMLTDLSRAQYLEPQQRNLRDKAWMLDSGSGIPFWIAGDWVNCSYFPSDRNIFVFMAPQTFTTANLIKVFRHVSDKRVQPEFLTIFVRTDPVVLQKWMDLYRPLSSNPRDASGLSDTSEYDLYEETKVGCYQAEYFRSYGNESFSYSPDPHTGQRVTVRLSDRPLEFQYTGEMNSDLVDAARKGCVNCVKSLLEQGADVNWKNKYGMTPLLAAVDLRRTEIVEVLLERGADINVNAYGGWTPLLCAASAALSESLAIELARSGADVNARTECGDTALILATQMGVEEARLVETLLDKGADFTVKDRFGRTPLQIAHKHHHRAIARLLEKRGAENQRDSKLL